MHVALLRGINVGGHRVRNEVLRGVFERVGCREVTTFIASGNVVFEAPTGARTDRGTVDEDALLATRLSAALEEDLGWGVPVAIRTTGEVAAVVAVVAASSHVAAEGETLQVGFWPVAPPPGAARVVERLAPETDELWVEDRELYWLCRGPVHASKLTVARIDRAAGVPVTFRNVTTLRRIADTWPP